MLRKAQEIKERNEMLIVDCNHSYMTRFKTAQLATPKSMKSKLLMMSFEKRDRLLGNFLLPKEFLTNAEKMSSRKDQNLVNCFQHSLILQNSVIKELSFK